MMQGETRHEETKVRNHGRRYEASCALYGVGRARAQGGWKGLFLGAGSRLKLLSALPMLTSLECLEASRAVAFLAIRRRLECREEHGTYSKLRP